MWIKVKTYIAKMTLRHGKHSEADRLRSTDAREARPNYSASAVRLLRKEL